MRGTSSPDNDALQFFGPYHMRVGMLARTGELLLWNPLTNAGSPDYIEPQVGAVSPTLLATAWLAGGAEWGFRLYWFLVWFGGAAGIIVLGRHVGAPAWGCACVASGFMMSGFYTGHAQHTPMLAAASHLPWLLWRSDVAFLRGRRSAAVQAGVILGLSGLGGYPGVLVLNGLACVAWLAGRGVTARRAHGRALLTAGVTLLVIGGVAAVVLSPTYVAFFVEGAGFTYRTGALPRWLVVDNNPLVPWNVATLASASAYRWPLGPAQDLSMRSLYLGVLIPSLAACAVTTRDRWWCAWVLLCAAFFVAAALGPSLPVRGWLYDLVPPTRYFRHASLFRAPAMCLLAVLALVGAKEIDRIWQRARWWHPAIASTGVGVVLCALYAVIGRPPTVPKDAAYASTYALWLAVPLSMALAARFRARARSLRVLVTCLLATATVDAVLTARISAPQVYGRHVEAWRRLDRVRDPSPTPSRLLAREEASLDNWNLVTGVPVLRSYAPLGNPLHAALASDPVLSTMALGSERFWFSARPPVVEPSTEIVATLGSAMRTRGTPVVALHPRNVMRRSATTAEGAATEPGSAVLVQPRLLAYDSTTLEFEVSTPASGWVVVTDRWAPGWKGSVNGVEVPVHGANAVFRAVQVRPGENVIRMQYTPFGYPWLVALSWCTIAASLCGPAIVGRRRRVESRGGFPVPGSRPSPR